jgi:hypothetical protein
VLADYANNAQCVIDGLSKQIQMGLQHISGESIAKGELRALTNVVDILRRIASITRCWFLFPHFSQLFYDIRLLHRSGSKINGHGIQGSRD